MIVSEYGGDYVITLGAFKMRRTIGNCLPIVEQTPSPLNI